MGGRLGMRGAPHLEKFKFTRPDVLFTLPGQRRSRHVQPPALKHLASTLLTQFSTDNRAKLLQCKLLRQQTPCIIVPTKSAHGPSLPSPCGHVQRHRPQAGYNALGLGRDPLGLFPPLLHKADVQRELVWEAAPCGAAACLKSEVGEVVPAARASACGRMMGRAQHMNGAQ